MKIFKLVKYSILAIALSLGTMGCKKEKGPVGPSGPSGQDGTDGSDGTDGTDGNADVKSYIFIKPLWVDEPIAHWMDIDMSSILTAEMIKNDVILGYVKGRAYSLINPIPGVVSTGSTDQQYKVNIFNNGSGIYRIVSYELDGSFTPSADLKKLDWVKVVIIKASETTTTTGNGMIIHGKDAVLKQLQNANVDINNYEEVCNYYGISAE